MISHIYQLQPRRVVLNLVWISTMFLLVAGVVRGLDVLNWLPEPKPTATVDWLLVQDRIRQVNLENDAEILVAGDSTAAMGLNARLLGHEQTRPVSIYNMSLFIGLTLKEYGQSVGGFMERHPGQVRMVLLLVSADRLAHPHFNPQSMAYWEGALAGREADSTTALGRTQEEMGMREVRLHFLNRWLPFVTHFQEEGEFYGIVYEVAEMMERQNGSFSRAGYYNQDVYEETANFNLDDANLETARLFRQYLPDDVLLAFGLTPYPETYVGENARTRRDALMRRFNEALQADVLLTNLPVALPDGYFRDRLHLNPRGQEAYTKRVAEELRPIVEPLP